MAMELEDTGRSSASENSTFPAKPLPSTAVRVKLMLGPAFITVLLLLARKRRVRAGPLLWTVGILHMAGGAYVGRALLHRIRSRGIIGEGDSGLGEEADKIPQEMLFWFLLWGDYIIMLGQLVEQLEKQRGRIPLSLSLHFSFSTLLSAFLYPKGGFWLMLIPAYLLLRRHLPFSETAPAPPAGRRY